MTHKDRSEASIPPSIFHGSQKSSTTKNNNCPSPFHSKNVIDVLYYGATLAAGAKMRRRELCMSSQHSHVLPNTAHRLVAS